MELADLSGEREICDCLSGLLVRLPNVQRLSSHSFLEFPSSVSLSWP